MCCFTYMQTSASNVTKLCIQTATTRLSLMIDEYVSYSCTAARCLRSEIKYTAKVKYANQNHRTTPQSSTGSNDVIDRRRKQKT